MQHTSTRSGETPRNAETSIKPPRRRHWWRGFSGASIGVVVLAVAVTGVVVKLDAGACAARAAEGRRRAVRPARRHVAGRGGIGGRLRVRETVIGFSNDVTGRTGGVTGTVMVAGAAVSSATFQVSLGTIAVDGKTRQPQLVQSLGVAAHPVATVTLTRPVPLPAAFSAGAKVTWTVAATLTLNGMSRPVTVALSAQRDGTAIDASGSLPVAFTDFGINGPHGYGFLGSLASDGTAEFLVILRSQ